MNRWGVPARDSYRALFYLIAILMIGALINLFLDRKIYSLVGTNDSCLCRLLLLRLGLYLLIVEFCRLPAVSGRNLAGMSVFAAVLVLFCSMEWIRKLYDFVMDGICKILFSRIKKFYTRSKDMV